MARMESHYGDGVVVTKFLLSSFETSEKAGLCERNSGYFILNFIMSKKDSQATIIYLF